MRFFGKIWGSKSDYYVVEITGAAEGGEGEEEGAGEEAGEPEAGMEAPGTGVNKFTYWVAPSSLSDWTKLPELSPADIAASRQVKVAFTGELNRAIYTNPHFFGQEKHYLRAQIARIMHSTTLVPKGIYKITDPVEAPRDIDLAEPEEGDETVKMPTTKDMANPSNWAHF
jgi:radial spoke head protein 4/6